MYHFSAVWQQPIWHHFAKKVTLPQKAENVGCQPIWMKRFWTSSSQLRSFWSLHSWPGLSEIRPRCLVFFARVRSKSFFDTGLISGRKQWKDGKQCKIMNQQSVFNDFGHRIVLNNYSADVCVGTSLRDHYMWHKAVFRQTLLLWVFKNKNWIFWEKIASCVQNLVKREIPKVTKFCKKSHTQPIFLLKKLLVLFLNTRKSNVCPLFHVKPAQPCPVHHDDDREFHSGHCASHCAAWKANESKRQITFQDHTLDPQRKTAGNQERIQGALGARLPCPQHFIKILHFQAILRKNPNFKQFLSSGPPWGQNSAGPPNQNPGSAPGNRELVCAY